MTLIAVDSTHIAADGMSHTGERISGRDVQKMQIVRVNGKDRIFALTGLYCMFDPVINWVTEGAYPKNIPNCPGGGPGGFEYWSLLEVSSDGLRMFASDLPYAERQQAPFTMGCGRDYALGLMWGGMSAPEAVTLLCDGRLHGVGGKIQVIDIMEVTGFTLSKEVSKEEPWSHATILTGEKKFTGSLGVRNAEDYR